MAHLPQVTGIGIATVFAVDFQTSFAFYHEILELNEVVSMNDHACYFKINDEQGLYLVGGYAAKSRVEKECMTTFALNVRSVSETHRILFAAGVELVHTEPVQMNDTDYWFQCYDPSSNIIEFIGPR